MSKRSRMNKLLILPLAVIVLLLGVLSVSATIDCNLTKPSNSGYITKLTELNATFNVSSVWDNITIQLEARSSNTASNQSFVVIANIINTTNLRHANFTFPDSINFPDATYDFRATCVGAKGLTTLNGENSTLSSTITGVFLDRSVPTITGLQALTGGQTTTAQTITFGVINTTSYDFVEVGRPVKSKNILSSLQNQTYSEVITPSNGGSYYLIAYDGQNSTTSASITLTISGNAITGITLGGVPQEVTERLVTQHNINANKNKTLTVIVIGVASTFVIIMLILALNKKKGKRRR